MGGSSKAPAADPRMAEAAMLSAKTGQDMLAWAKGQSGITNAWAAEDRARNQSLFQPIENRFVAESANYDTEARRKQEAARAEGAVLSRFGAADAGRRRQMAAMGVRPDSGRAGALDRQSSVATGLAAAGAGEMARRNVEQQGYSRMANIVNLGQGGAVNPATSMGLANNAGGAGFQGAMQGYGQQANILGVQHDQQMREYQANQNGMNGLMGALGMGAGLIANGGFMLSDEGEKEGKAALDFSPLGAVRGMRVEKWRYKAKHGDDREHVGTYAQDFQRETGMGDGHTIPIQSAFGVVMGAVKELDAQMQAMGARRSARAA